MSAIYGAVSRRGKAIDERALARMVSRLRYRGPDGHHELNAPKLTFGHLLLHTDHPGSPPPLARAGAVITCDARLDNRAQLIRLLDLPAADSLSDADVIVAAWQRWHTACPEHLAGSFAFCLWDETRQQLFCARDRLGIKPLCYCVTPDLLLFATEASAIDACMAGLPINRLRMAEYLLGHEAADFTSTFFQGVSRLAPGHHLVMDGHGVKLTRYWQPRVLDAPTRDPAELVELCRSLLAQSVERHRSRTSTTACLLSGGLDSATVFDHLARQSADVLACSAISRQPDCADTRAVERLTATTTAANLQQVALEDASAWLPDVLPVYARLDEPFAAVMTMATALYVAAARRGATVVLDGVEGDLVYSMFASYPQALFNEGSPLAALSELWHMSQQRYAAPFPSSLARFLLGRLVPGRLKQQRRRVRGSRALQDALAASLLSREMQHDPAVLAHLRQPGEEVDASSTLALHRYWLKQPILVTGIERYDRMAAACQVEARHPLLDVDLVEFAMNLPWYMKRHRATTKLILRKAMQDRLPAEIAARKDKPHLGWRFNEMVMVDQWDQMKTSLLASGPLLSEWVDIEQAVQCFAQSAYDPEHPDAAPWDINALRQWMTCLQHRTDPHAR